MIIVIGDTNKLRKKDIKGIMGKILALASYSNGTMNIPKEVKEALKITESKGKVAFYLENGKVIIEKA
jgi:hypothetical protein